MELNMEQRILVEEYLKEFWPVTCPICRHSDWKINIVVWDLKESRPPEEKREPWHNPLLEMVCKKCGKAEFFDPRDMGILDDIESPGKYTSERLEKRKQQEKQAKDEKETEECSCEHKEDAAYVGYA